MTTPPCGTSFRLSRAKSPNARAEACPAGKPATTTTEVVAWPSIRGRERFAVHCAVWKRTVTYLRGFRGSCSFGRDVESAGSSRYLRLPI